MASPHTLNRATATAVASHPVGDVTAGGETRAATLGTSPSPHSFHSLRAHTASTPVLPELPQFFPDVRQLDAASSVVQAYIRRKFHEERLTFFRYPRHWPWSMGASDGRAPFLDCDSVPVGQFGFPPPNGLSGTELGGGLFSGTATETDKTELTGTVEPREVFDSSTGTSYIFSLNSSVPDAADAVCSGTDAQLELCSTGPGCMYVLYLLDNPECAGSTLVDGPPDLALPLGVDQKTSSKRGAQPKPEVADPSSPLSMAGAQLVPMRSAQAFVASVGEVRAHSPLKSKGAISINAANPATHDGEVSAHSPPLTQLPNQRIVPESKRVVHYSFAIASRCGAPDVDMALRGYTDAAVAVVDVQFHDSPDGALVKPYTKDRSAPGGAALAPLQSPSYTAGTVVSAWQKLVKLLASPQLPPSQTSAVRQSAVTSTPEVSAMLQDLSFAQYYVNQPHTCYTNPDSESCASSSSETPFRKTFRAAEGGRAGGGDPLRVAFHPETLLLLPRLILPSSICPTHPSVTTVPATAADAASGAVAPSRVSPSSGPQAGPATSFVTYPLPTRKTEGTPTSATIPSQMSSPMGVVLETTEGRRAFAARCEAAAAAVTASVDHAIGALLFMIPVVKRTFRRIPTVLPDTQADSQAAGNAIPPGASGETGNKWGFAESKGKGGDTSLPHAAAGSPREAEKPSTMVKKSNKKSVTASPSDEAKPVAPAKGSPREGAKSVSGTEGVRGAVETVVEQAARGESDSVECDDDMFVFFSPRFLEQLHHEGVQRRRRRIEWQEKTTGPSTTEGSAYVQEKPLASRPAAQENPGIVAYPASTASVSKPVKRSGRQGNGGFGSPKKRSAKGSELAMEGATPRQEMHTVVEAAASGPTRDSSVTIVSVTSAVANGSGFEIGMCQTPSPERARGPAPLFCRSMIVPRPLQMALSLAPRVVDQPASLGTSLQDSAKAGLPLAPSAKGAPPLGQARGTPAPSSPNMPSAAAMVGGAGTNRTFAFGPTDESKVRMCSSIEIPCHPRSYFSLLASPIAAFQSEVESMCADLVYELVEKAADVYAGKLWDSVAPTYAASSVWEEVITFVENQTHLRRPPVLPAPLADPMSSTAGAAGAGSSAAAPPCGGLGRRQRTTAETENLLATFLFDPELWNEQFGTRKQRAEPRKTTAFHPQYTSPPLSPKRQHCTVGDRMFGPLDVTPTSAQPTSVKIENYSRNMIELTRGTFNPAASAPVASPKRRAAPTKATASVKLREKGRQGAKPASATAPNGASTARHRGIPVASSHSSARLVAARATKSISPTR